MARVLVACFLPAVLVVAGCGQKRRDVAPVSGRVTLQGKPLANIAVNFQPVAQPGAKGGEAGSASYGVTDADGRFQLKTIETFDGRPGAVVGKHVVYLSVYEPPRPSNVDTHSSPAASPLPRRAYDGSLVFEVPPGGAAEANFDY